jgi:hypothetical protein
MEVAATAMAAAAMEVAATAMATASVAAAALGVARGCGGEKHHDR